MKTLNAEQQAVVDKINKEIGRDFIDMEWINTIVLIDMLTDEELEDIEYFEIRIREHLDAQDVLNYDA